MVEKLGWCIMSIYKFAFYANLLIFICLNVTNSNTEMITYSFQCTVLLGIFNILKSIDRR